MLNPWLKENLNLLVCQFYCDFSLSCMVVMSTQDLKHFEGGSQNPEDWLFHLELVSDANSWTPDQKLKKAFVYLSGEALAWYKNVYFSNGAFNNYEVFKKAFL